MSRARASEGCASTKRGGSRKNGRPTRFDWMLSMAMRARANFTANAASAKLGARRIETLRSFILKCCFDRNMATLGFIEYADAPAEVRAVYDDIMATRQTD